MKGCRTSFMELGLEVYYTFTPPSPGDHLTPADPGGIELTAVKVGAVNILSELSTEQTEILERECWEEVEDSMELL